MNERDILGKSGGRACRPGPPGLDFADSGEVFFGGFQNESDRDTGAVRKFF